MANRGVGLLISFCVSICGTFGKEFTFRGIQGCAENYKSPFDANMTTLVTTSFDCVRECGRLDWCASVNVCPSSEPDMVTCEKMTFTSNWSCENLDPEPDCTYQEKALPTCFNGGTYVKGNQTCLCIFGFTGDWCERYYYDCSEAYQKTLVDRGQEWLTIQPKTSPSPFLVSCYLAWGGYTYIESRHIHCDVIMFNRTWDELKQPIINTDCSYWIGLEHIHHLTSQADYLLDIYVTGPNSYYGHPLYENFSIGNEADGYRMTYGSFSSHVHPADDAFSIDGANGPNGHPFATMDRPDAGGCAISENAAWWYGPSCPIYNLHLSLGAGSAPQHAIWRHLGADFELTSFAAQISTNW